MLQPFCSLDEPGASHRYLKPIKPMVSFGTELQREVAHRIAAVRQEGNRLIHVEALLRQHLKEAAFRVLIIPMHEPLQRCPVASGHAAGCAGLPGAARAGTLCACWWSPPTS